MKKIIGLTSALTISGSVLGQPPTEVISGAAEREATAITVYDDDLVLIKERRKVKLPAGLARLSLRDVAARIKPETALLTSLDQQPLTLIEQSYDFDMLTPRKMLDKYVGKEVGVIRTNPATGVETLEKAVVLSSYDGVVLKFADRIETGVPGRMVFDSVPATLRDRPTLSVLLNSAGGEQAVELSYLSQGFNWRADYVANLDADAKHINLSAWVTLNNQSGASFENVKLQLVAGDVNQVSARMPLVRPMMASPEPKGSSGNVVREEVLMDYHMYQFEALTDIAHDQSKQIALLSAQNIPVQHEYVLAGNDYYYRNRMNLSGKKINPHVFVGFENKSGELGRALPAGVVRVYAKDSSGAAQFVGEDKLRHTAKNEWVRLALGKAFDITAERDQTAFSKIAEKVAETSYRVEVRNAKDKAVTLRVLEPLSGDWKILKENHPSTRENAQMAYWTVTVPSNGSTVLEYTVRATWQ